jgi:hypothetical protein
MEAQRSLAFLLIISMPLLSPTFHFPGIVSPCYQHSPMANQRRPARDVKPARPNSWLTTLPAFSASTNFPTFSYRSASDSATKKWEQRKYKTKLFYFIFLAFSSFSEAFFDRKSSIPITTATTQMLCLKQEMKMDKDETFTSSAVNVLTATSFTSSAVNEAITWHNMIQSTSRCFVMFSWIKRTEWYTMLPFHVPNFHEQIHVYFPLKDKCWHTTLSAYSSELLAQQTQAPASFPSKWRHIMRPPCFSLIRTQTDISMNFICNGKIPLSQFFAPIRHFAMLHDNVKTGPLCYLLLKENRTSTTETQKFATFASGNHQLAPKSTDMLAEHSAIDATKAQHFLLHRRKKLTESLQRTLICDINFVSINIPRDFTHFPMKTPTFPNWGAKTTSTITMPFDSSQIAQIHAPMVTLKFPSLFSNVRDNLVTPLDENLFITLNSWPAHSIYYQFRKISKNELLSLESNPEMPVTLEIRWHLPGGTGTPRRQGFDGHGELPSSDEQDEETLPDAPSPTGKPKRTATENLAASSTKTKRSLYQQAPRSPSKVYTTIDMDFVMTTTKNNADILDSDPTWRFAATKHDNEDINKLRTMLQLHDIKLLEGTIQRLKQYDISPAKLTVATALSCQRFNEFRLPDLKQYFASKTDPQVTFQFRHFRPPPSQRTGSPRSILQALYSQLLRTGQDRAPITMDTVQYIEQGTVEQHTRKGEAPDFFNGFFTAPLNDPALISILRHGGLCSDSGLPPFLLLPEATPLTLTETATYKVELAMRVLTQSDPFRYENGRIPIFLMYRMINHFLDKDSAKFIFGPHHATSWMGDRARTTVLINSDTRLAFFATEPIKALQQFARKKPYLDIWGLVRIYLDFEPELPKNLHAQDASETPEATAQRCFGDTCTDLPLVLLRPARPWMPSTVDGKYTRDNRPLQEQVTKDRVATLDHFHLLSIAPVFNNYYAHLLLNFATVDAANDFLASWNSPAPTAAIRAFEELVNSPQERAFARAMLVPHFELRRLQRSQLQRALAIALPPRPKSVIISPSKTIPKRESIPANSAGPAFLQQDAPDLYLLTPGAARGAEILRSGDLRSRLNFRERFDRTTEPQPSPRTVVLRTRSELARNSLPQEILSSIATAAADRAMQMMAPQHQRLESQISQTHANVQQIHTNVSQMRSDIRQVQTSVNSFEHRVQQSELLIADIFRMRFGHLIPPAETVPGHTDGNQAPPRDPPPPPNDQPHA